jgi:prevent-host-death family protein
LVLIKVYTVFWLSSERIGAGGEPHFLVSASRYCLLRRVRGFAAVYIAILDSYNTVMQVSVADAKNKLPELIKAVEDGEPVTICRRGVPVVDIVRTKEATRKKRKLGTLKGKIEILDPNWWKPMTDKEVEAFLVGRG